MNDTRPTIRLDKWLWYARFFKTRTLSGKVVSAGHVRVDAVKVLKPSVAIGAGDTLTFAQEQDIRVVRILDVGKRRGPAIEAQLLYEDLDPPKPKERFEKPERGGRPTKQDRRTALRIKGKTFD